MNDELTYMGHVISALGITPGHVKIEAVHTFLAHKNIVGVQTFSGLVNYYMIFKNSFATIATPLYIMLKKGISFKWSQVEKNAFDTLKLALCTSPNLVYPSFDVPFLLQN